MENRQLFLRIVDDLDRRLLSTDEYVVLGAARLLRQLLLDDQPLIQAVVSNQPIKLVGPGTTPPPKIVFSIADYIPPTARPHYWWTLIDAFDPDRSPQWEYLHAGREVVYASLEVEGTLTGQSIVGRSFHLRDLEHVAPAVSVPINRLLNSTIVVYEHQVFSVKHVIKHLANFSGAVHFSRAKQADEREQALEALLHKFYIEYLPLGVYLLLSIGRVVRRALQDLEKYVHQNPLAERAHYSLSAQARPENRVQINITPPGGGHIALVTPPSAPKQGPDLEL